jgi:pimeloyl-ACP methyl ester carboxylesterase
MPQVVFLHPIGLDRRIWADIHVPGATALDLPGHGDTPAADQVSLDRLVDYVLAQLTGPATLVGLSLGGMVAQQVALREPSAVASLVVACSTSASNPEVMFERSAATRQGGMAGVLDTTLDRWFTPEALATPGHPGVEYARRRLLDDDPEVVAQYWEAMSKHDVRERLPSLKVPATFIAGAEDRASSLAVLEGMARAVPDAVLRVLDGPHMLPLEQPREFTEALSEHLEHVYG